jgi:gas vesicle protein
MRMEWQHYNRIKASMSFIEELLKSMEEGMSGKGEIYKSVRNDLNQEQLTRIKDEIKQIKNLLKQTKEEFNLERTEFTLSRIIQADCSFIWETIEDLWSHKIEKSSGKISSKEKKDKLDAIIRQIYERNSRIQNLIEK